MFWTQYFFFYLSSLDKRGSSYRGLELLSIKLQYIYIHKKREVDVGSTSSSARLELARVRVIDRRLKFTPSFSL